MDGQVRSFDRVRERLLAAGKDPSESYRQFEARRKKLVAALKQPRSGSVPPNFVDPQLPVARLHESLFARPILAARFDPTLGIFGFGSAGVVQVAPAGENTNVVAQGPFPHSGEIGHDSRQLSRRRVFLRQPRGRPGRDRARSV